MVIDDITIGFTDLGHSYGMCFTNGSKTYAIMADSDYHKSLVNALQDIEFGIFGSRHITDDGIIRLAVNTQVKK